LTIPIFIFLSFIAGLGIGFTIGLVYAELKWFMTNPNEANKRRKNKTGQK